MDSSAGEVLDAQIMGAPKLTPAENRVWQAAVLLFAQKGYAATGIRDIAKAAGITSATLYHYAANKEALLVQIMTAGQRSLTQNAVTMLEQVERPEERLGVLVANLVGAHATNPMTTVVVDTEVRALSEGTEHYQLVVGLRDEYELLWRQVLELGAAEGVFGFGDEHVTRLGLLTMCAGLSRWYKPGGTDGTGSMIERFTDTALGTVRAARDGRWVRSHDLTPRPYVPVSLPWEPWLDRDRAAPNSRMDDTAAIASTGTAQALLDT